MVVFVVAVVLRLVLGTVNREASDNHVDVIDIMAFENRIPEYDRATDRVKEAFQPKLYHGTVAALLKIDPVDPKLRPCRYDYPGSPHVLWVGQMVSAVAGILTLFVVLRFLGLLDVSDRTRCFAFSLVALNPALIAINVQVTNDSFVILFGSLALYWGYRFFRNFRATELVWMTAAAIATAMSKATGLPVCFAIAVVFAITFARGPQDGAPSRLAIVGYAVVFVVALLSWFTIIAPKPGSYYEQYRRYGSPFATNRVPEPFPHLFEQTMFTGDPGVRSIAEAIFTFRIIDLVRNPILLDHDREHFPIHRTSLWSQVYGRLNSIRFEHLPSWRPESALVTNLPRLTFLVALLPLGLLVSGACRGLARVLSDVGRVRSHEWLIAVTATGYVVFLAVLALRYRDYSFFKPIHAFAGTLAFLPPLAYGCDHFWAARAHRSAMQRLADVVMGTVIVLYALDCTLLAVQLFESCRHP
jgi:hypothetical protein